MVSRARLFLLLLATLVAGGPALAADSSGVKFSTLSYQDVTFDLVEVDLRKAHLRLHWKASGRRLGSLHAVRDLLANAGETPLAITNAGIFGNEVPVGLHVEDGKRLHPLNRGRSGGNFFMLPNGVFFVDERG